MGHWGGYGAAQRPGQVPDEAQIAALKGLLTELSDDDLIWFTGDFQRAQEALNVRLLWVAADFANEFCSDDGFTDFRTWIISRGRAAYEKVHANPDELVSLLPTPEGCPPHSFSFEGFGFVAGALWDERKGEWIPVVDVSEDPWEPAADLGVGVAYSGVSPEDAPDPVRGEVMMIRDMGISWDQIRDKTGFPETYEPNFLSVPLDRIPEALPRMYAWGQAAFGVDLERLRADPLTQTEA